MLLSNEASPNNVNELRRAFVTLTFKEGVGRRVFILTEEIPFMIIGKIEKVMSDYVFICVETTHIDQFEGKTFRVHIDAITVFYIEEPGKPIPRIKDDDHCDCDKKRGD